MGAQFRGDVCGMPDLCARLRRLVAGGIGGAGVDDKEFIDERDVLHQLLADAGDDRADGFSLVESRNADGDPL